MLLTYLLNKYINKWIYINDSSFNSIDTYHLNSRSVNFCQTDTWFFREFAWRNFDVKIQQLKAQRNKNLPPLHLTEFSLPVSAQSLCALRTSAQGSRCLDVDFWREKIRGKILRSETSNSAIYLLWRELTRTDLLRRHLLAKHWTKQNSKSKDDTKKFVFWLKLK